MYKIKVSTLKQYFVDHSIKYFVMLCSKDNGLKYMLIRSGTLGIFWVVAVILVNLVMIVMLIQVYKAYQEFPLITQIKIEDSEFQFPDVTICPKSPFADVTAPNFKKILEQLSKKTQNILSQASVKITKESLQAGLLLQLLKYDNSYAPKLYLHIIYCKYNGEDCSFFNFTEIIHPRYIKCFEFKPNKRVLRTGMGLTVVYFTSILKRPFMILNDLEDLNLFSKEENDGINVLVHPPLTFPSYEINYLPTSFSLRYGTHTTLAVTSLKYNSNLNRRKPCFENPPTFKYQNFRGDKKFLEYNYTYEDCVANKKQQYIKNTCECYSDKLFVPYIEGETQSPSGFCRYILGKTSEKIRQNFFCHEIHSAVSSTFVLDQYISPEKLLANKDNPDVLKLLRLNICSMACIKEIYDAILFKVEPINDLRMPVRKFKSYFDKLKEGQFMNADFEKLYTQGRMLNGSNMIFFEIKAGTESTDVWQEDRAMTSVVLLSELGGIMGLCSGISFLTFIILASYFVICCGNYFLYVLMTFLESAVCKDTVVKEGSDSDKSSIASNELTRIGDHGEVGPPSSLKTKSPIISRGPTSSLKSKSPIISRDQISSSIYSDSDSSSFDYEELERLRLKVVDGTPKEAVMEPIGLPVETNWENKVKSWKVNN